jgi:glutathione S-transferase
MHHYCTLFERTHPLTNAIGAAFGLAPSQVDLFFVAAAQLSTVDYIGDVPWDDHPDAKDWYARIKSRPSFRGLLTDQIPGMPPPSHYADLDF